MLRPFLRYTRLNTCWDVCDGGAWWLYNILCCPIVLVYKAIVIYFLGCLGVLFHRLFRALCGRPCQICCPVLYQFRDKHFPPTAASIVDFHEQPNSDNPFYKMNNSQIDEKIEWFHASELMRKLINERKRLRKGIDDLEGRQHFYLFEDGIDPDDIIQGSVGNCWLLAALASLAEHPEAVRNIFVQKEYSSRGKYTLRLWDDSKERWTRITVDDYVPVKRGTTTPYFSRPKGNELWVFLIEKAFAKYVGGYAYLDGGFSAWAWHVLTGDNVFLFELGEYLDHWKRSIYKFEPDSSKKNQRHRMMLRDTKERCDHRRMFELLKNFSKHRAMMTASIRNRDRAKHGLVSSHAYSLIEAKSVGVYHLVKLRNPWSDGEWTGPWSDKCERWHRHPDVARKCANQARNANDGTFWMAFDDFRIHFDRIQVCDRSAFRDLNLAVNEDQGCAGVVQGCLYGCASYWCLCRGLRIIYFGHRTSREVTYSPGPCTCMRDTGNFWIEGIETDTSIV